MEEHQHSWRHLGGHAFGMYRCDKDSNCCLAMGYSKVYRGASINQKVVPYKCAKCGGWAVAKDKVGYRKREWRCTHHRTE